LAFDFDFDFLTLRQKMGVLRLQLPTDPRWVNIVKKHWRNPDGSCLVWTKAATNAITIITHNSEHQDLVQDLLALAKENRSFWAST
jgi:tRNA-(ms[2]io[6]A)-hydroxylase